MATRPVTKLIWMAVLCISVSLSSANAEPDSFKDRLSGTRDGFRSGNREAMELIRRILDDENIDFDSASDEAPDDNTDLYERLLRVLSSHETDKDEFKKRTCKFNLGGHCATENAVKMADQYNFLKSSMSPGRRRRRSSLSSFSSSSASSHAAVKGHVDRKGNQILTRPNQRPVN